MVICRILHFALAVKREAVTNIRLVLALVLVLALALTLACYEEGQGILSRCDRDTSHRCLSVCMSVCQSASLPVYTKYLRTFIRAPLRCCCFAPVDCQSPPRPLAAAVNSHLEMRPTEVCFTLATRSTPSASELEEKPLFIQSRPSF